MARDLDYTRARAVIAFLTDVCGLIMLPWMRSLVLAVYATDRVTGLRVITRVLLSCGRKNGKTHLLAGLLLCHLVGPEARFMPPASHIISTAGGSKDQASMVYQSMVAIIESNPALGAVLQINANTIYHLTTLSYYEFLPTNARTIHGRRPAVFGYDELAQALDNQLYGALDLGQGTFDEPLGFVVSTNSTLPGQPLAVLIDGVQRGIENGKMAHWVCRIYAADRDQVDDNPLLLKHVRKANPSYGTLLKPESVKREIEEARAMPSKMTEYRAARLNLDVDSDAAFVDTHRWRKCADSDMRLEDFAGMPCIVSVDLGDGLSLASMALYIPDDVANPSRGGAMFSESWIPHDAIPTLSETHGADYRQWNRTGAIHTTPGEGIDLRHIVDRIEEVGEIVRIVDVRRDTYKGKAFQTELSERGSPIVTSKIVKGWNMLGPASDHFIKLVTTGGLRHDDNPVGNMCLANTAAITGRGSTSAQVRPGRLRPHLPNDACVAMVSCLVDLDIEVPTPPRVVDVGKYIDDVLDELDSEDYGDLELLD